MTGYVDENFRSLPETDQQALSVIEDLLRQSEYLAADEKWQALSDNAKNSHLGQVQHLELKTIFHRDYVGIYESAEPLVHALVEARNGEILRRALRCYVDSMDLISSTTEVLVFCSILAEKIRNDVVYDVNTHSYLLATIASRYAEVKDFAAARRYLDQVHKNLPSVSLETIHGSVYWVESIIFEAQGQYDEAVVSLELAIPLYEKAHLRPLFEALKGKVAQLATKKRDLDSEKAQRYVSLVRESMTEYSPLLHPRMHAVWCWIYLKVLHNLGDWVSVIEHGRYIMNFGFANFEDAGSVKCVIADAHWRLGDSSAASHLLEQAVAEMQISTMCSETRDHLRDAAQLYAEMGDAQRAYETLLIATTSDPHLSRSLDKALNK